jgi:hypothetical protein
LKHAPWHPDHAVVLGDLDGLPVYRDPKGNDPHYPNVVK